MDRAKVKNILNFNFSRDRVFGFADAGFNRETFDKNLARLAEIGNSMVEVRDFLTEEEIRLLVQRLHKLWHRVWSRQVNRAWFRLFLTESTGTARKLDAFVP